MSALPDVNRVKASIALYVHMPWCVRKCPYCDFNSHQLKGGLPDRAYLDALIRDFELEAPWLEHRQIDTVFFGGGTPSLFSPDDYARLLAAFRQRSEIAEDAEITLEANPGTVERGRFSGYRDAGINRVSLGVQSFSSAALQKLGRIHSAEDTQRAARELRGARIDNFNLDLMYALPGQTLEEARFDVQTAIALGPSHISYYQLTVEPGTVFFSRPPPLPDEEAAWRIQIECQALIENAGYRQYEVSAYARYGAQCRHNLNYWSFGDYIGIGAGAHGKLSDYGCGNILRTVKPKQPRDYLARVHGAQAAVGERTAVAVADLPFEFMLNALRLNDGFDATGFEARTGLAMSVVVPTLSAMQARGLVEPKPSGWRPTARGRLFLNDLQAAFLA